MKPRRRHALGIVLAVLAAHAGAFWFLADKHFLPKTRRTPAAPLVNFAARQRTATDPATGETSTVTDYVVSTRMQPQTPPAPTSPVP